MIVVPILAVILHKRVAGIRRSRNDHIERLEELSKLTGGLAHEIKNPLSTIKINLQLIAEELERPGSAVSASSSDRDADRAGARALRKIGVVQKETDRLEQILDGFLRYIGRTELERTDVDINELLGDMVDFYAPQAHTRAITVRQGLHDGPLVCKIDGDMLKQAILNLLINARDAMPSGGELMIRTEKKDNDAIIRISDTGTGIAPDKLTHIFEAYYSSRPQGSGLGLPTARKIIEAHQGTILAESDLGKGASFTITLPLRAN